TRCHSVPAQPGCSCRSGAGALTPVCRPPLRSGERWGDMGAALSAVSRGIAMAAVSARRTLLVPALVSLVHTTALAQTAAPPPTRGVASGATAAWTLRLKGDIRWQQVTPAGVLLVSTDAALAGVDI